ncbi:unnamed protein product [Schistosoma rodhaini]|uniref:PHTF1/2 N-terminal domain-containing protein n=3 Tax=Schistosoma TaxID=6181 RepID=A0AA85F2G4_9TREM|nr:unnamed protein product [Schistosoma rodhaini]
MWRFELYAKLFQLKLSNYDKHPWEHGVEQRILQGIDRHSTRDGKTRSGLIDVDVIRGSVFAKAKTGHGWMAAVRWGLLRVAFAPFYWNYWRSHTSFRVAVYIMVHFFLQFLQVVFFLLTDPRTSNSSQDDLLLPCLLAVCLGILHAHITAPHGKTGLYSSFIDNPMTNQSFKEIGDHGLNSNCFQYNPDNLVNNKFSGIQSVINRHGEYGNSSWFPIQSTISEHHKFPTNIYSANHQSKNAPNPNKEPINSTSEQCGHSSSGCFECFKTSQLVDKNYAKVQRNINWRPGEMKPKRPLTSSYKFLKTHLDTDYQDDYSDLYGPGDDTQHELNISDFTHGTDGPQTPCTLDEECGRTKLLHNSQVLEHRSRVVRRRRRQNSYNSKLGNSSRGHDADVEESEGERVTVPSRKDIGEIGFSDQIVDGFNLDFIHQLQLKGGGSDHHFGSSNSDINPDSTVLPKRKQVSESPLDSSNLHTSAKLSNTLGDFSANTESSNKVGVLKTQSTSDSPIPLKTDQFTELECLPPHLSHISSLSSSFDSFVGSSRRSLKRSLSMSFPVHSKNTTTNVFLMLKKSFSDGLLNCLMNFHSSQCHLFGNELPYALKSPFQQKRDFQSNYNNTNDQAREVLKLCSNQRNRLGSENISYRKISLSSHSSGAAESSTNSARSFSSVRKFPKGNGRIFELESVHDVGAELTANPKCGRSSVEKHLDKKIYSSYTDIFKSQLIEDMKSTVQPVESSKEFQKLNELNEKRDLQPDNYGRSEFKNKSYECINKDDTITVFNRQRAKYLRLFLQRAFHLQHPRVVINSNQTDTDMLESDSVVLDSKWSNENSKYSGTYIPSSNNPDTNFKPSNQRVSSLNSTNKSCLKSTSPKVFYNWTETKSLSGNTNDRSQTTPTTDITNSQDAVTHAPKRHMKQYFGPVNGFVRNVYSHSHYFSKNESQDANMNGRGQTASENEYFDRINSDLGSDADSSSCPDEVESPSQPRENELRNWQHSNSMLHVNPDAAEKFRTVNKKQVSGRSDYHSCISKHYCPKCSSHLNVFLSPTTDSGQMNNFDDLKSVMNNNHQKPSESHELYESIQSVNDNGKNESLSSVHEEILHSIDFEVKEKLSDNQVTKRNVSKIQINSHLTRDSNGHENLLPSKVDTVRCYMWAGQKLSKFNLSMLDIGKNVIYAVERQSISSDYIIFACVATFALPFISIIFHSTNSSNILDNNNHNSSTDNSNQYQSLFITTQGTLLFFGNNSMNRTFNTNNAVFGDTVIGLYLHAMLSLFGHLFSTVSIKIHNTFIDTNLQTSSCSQSYCIVFWNIVTGQFLMDWFSKPDVQGRLVILIGFVLRFNVYGTVFFLLCIAERTFQERLLYAKYFFSLTSGRRALKYRVPQFRLNKVGHIKCWLMLRSYLKKRGPQRSVEHIMTIAFYIVFTLGLSLCAQLLSKSRMSVFTHLTNWDILGLCFGITVFLYRYILLGTKITKKYRNFSVLITEQINLYLSMESKPHKKEDLMLTFQVLRLVEGLLKEVDGPFRVCGWTLNPLVYNIFKLVLLSCVSTLLSESLGFKLKLYKLKLNPSNW